MYSILIVVTIILSQYPIISSYRRNLSQKKYINNIKAINNENNISSKDKVSSGLPPWLPSFATAATGGLLFGSDIGSSSSVVRILGAPNAEFGALDTFQLGQIASTSLFGAMIASGLLIYLGDSKIG